MSQQLTNCIVNHIFDNFGLTKETSLSIKDDLFLLVKSIDFIDENDNDCKAPLYGAQINIHSSKFRILVADFSKTNLEYALIIKLDGCPSYASYLEIDSATGDPFNGLICFSLKPNSWLKSNAAIQGTFLSGMESLKDVTASWTKLESFTDLFDELISFIEYQDSISDFEETL